MSDYLEVDTVKKTGKKILAVPIEQQPNVIAGNILVVILDNNMFEIAPNVTDKNEYNLFLNRYKSGWYTNFTLYLVPNEKSMKDNIPKVVIKRQNKPCDGVVCDNVCYGSDLFLSKLRRM